ncbi:MAG: hypothetical protein LUG99_14045 [Lachnospiraceae bacterium]|nr:hypothetical protein [Lachnospiraceae bacterium]
MVRYVIYADDAQDVAAGPGQAGMEALLRRSTLTCGEWAMIHFFIGRDQLDAYLSFVKQNPYLIMIAAVSGPDGRRVVEQIRENNKEARMIWFSDRQNGVYSYQINVTWFGLLPVTPEIIRQALEACDICPVSQKEEMPDAVNLK